MDRPEQLQLEESLKQLFFLGAITQNGDLSSLGSELAKFPLDPCFAKALMLSSLIGERTRSNKTLSDVVKLVSVLSTENIWTPVPRAD